jgi:O-antigen/teichoic acid export membrane protein
LRISNFSIKNKVLVNALTTVLQVVITAVVYLLLYKIMLQHVGVALIGVWAIVVATSSIANLAGLGLTSGLVKFVAEYHQSKQIQKIRELIFTSLVSTFGLYIIIALLVLACSNFILTKVIDIQYLAIAKELIPFSILCLVINGCSSIFISVIDGLQKNYLKNGIIIIGNLLYLILVFLLLRNGRGTILTVAKIQCVQAAVVMLIMALIVLKKIGASAVFVWNWSTQIFRQIFSYGIKFQAISIIQLLYEPLTKSLLGKFAGVDVVGYYEVASRLVFQVRGLIVNANQVLVPKIASNQSTNAVVDVYIKSIKYLLIIVLPIMSALLFFAIPISYFYIGSYQEYFIISVAILSVALFVNIISGPSYFTFIALGKLNPLLISHILIAIVNVVAAFSITLIYKELGVIVGWGLALIIGSIYVIHAFHKLTSTQLLSLLTKPQIITAYLGLFILGIGFFINIYFKFLVVISPFLLFGILLVLYLFFTLLVLYINREELIALKYFLKNKPAN